eukprot:6116710-Pyramimonas_sp.AAC.1
MWHRLRLQEACEIASHQSANSLALRRAVLSKTRPQPGPFERGEWVHYWRAGGRKRDRHGKWRGPDRVIGKDQFGYWLIHNGIPILAGPKILRRSTINDNEDRILGDQRDWQGVPHGQRGFVDPRSPTLA